MQLFQSQQGIIALISVLVMSILALTIILTTGFLGRGSLQFSLKNQQAGQALYLAQACAEVALIKLKGNPDYIGNETLDIQGMNCQIRPILGTGNENRTIQAIADYRNQVRKIQIIIAVVNPQTQISSWQEVADF